MGSWKYIGISSVDFKKSHIYEIMVHTIAVTLVGTIGMVCGT